MSDFLEPNMVRLSRWATSVVVHGPVYGLSPDLISRTPGGSVGAEGFLLAVRKALLSISSKFGVNNGSDSEFTKRFNLKPQTLNFKPTAGMLFFVYPSMSTFPLTKAIQVIFFLFLVFAGLYYARAFLIPVAFAGLLSMLFLPLSRRLENWGVSRALATLSCVLILVMVIAGIVWLIAWQVSDLASDVTNMEKSVQDMIGRFRQFISQNLGISKEQQDQLMKSQQSGGGGQAGSMITGLAGSIMGILVDLILVLVYIFLFMYFRRHLKTFVLKLVPQAQKKNAESIIHDTQHVAQQYLSGLGMMIVCLWIMYGIGFTIVGVKNAIFFAILCGLLEIVPFVGNLTGNALTILMALTQGGGMNMVIGILVTYAIVQFLQSYILEPLVVGAEVNINPLFTIIIIVVGETIWGIAGMVLAIPLLGIVKIICDHIEPLKPYGFLIGETKKKNKGGLIEKIKGWFK